MKHERQNMMKPFLPVGYIEQLWVSKSYIYLLAKQWLFIKTQVHFGHIFVL